MMESWPNPEVPRRWAATTDASNVSPRDADAPTTDQNAPEAKRARNESPRREASRVRKEITRDRPVSPYALLLLDRLHLRVFADFGFSSSRGGM
jgi:hypothetical protein